jgi:hypothetical protein
MLKYLLHSIHTQMVFKARIDKEAVDSERGVILSEYRDRNNVQARYPHSLSVCLHSAFLCVGL